MARSNPPASERLLSEAASCTAPRETRRRSGGLRSRALALPTVCQGSLIAPNLVGAGDDESPVRRHHIAERYL
jgi:hypothetical protein